MADKLKKDYKKKKKDPKWLDREDSTPPGVQQLKSYGKEGLDLIKDKAKWGFLPYAGYRRAKHWSEEGAKMMPESVKDKARTIKEFYTEAPRGRHGEIAPKERLKDKEEIKKLEELAAAAVDPQKTPDTKGKGGQLGAPPSPYPFLKDGIDQMEARLKGLPEGEQSVWEDEVGAIRDWAEGARESLDKRELAETLVHAISQLAAGWYGLKHGVDMSGLEFNKKDWRAELADLRGQTQSKLSETDKREAMRDRRASEIESKRVRAESDLDQLKGQLATEKYRAARDFWKAQMKAREDALKNAQMMKRTDISASHQASNKTITDLQKVLAADDKAEKKALLMKYMPPDALEQASETSWVDFVSDEESIDQTASMLIAKEQQNMARMKHGIDATALGKGVIVIPEYKGRKGVIKYVPPGDIPLWQEKYNAQVMFNAVDQD